MKTSQCLEKHKSSRVGQTLTLIESLSTIVENETERHPDAINFLKKFNKKQVKEDLLRFCFDEFNRKIFNNQLPSDTKLIWNSRLSSTAGYCKNITRLGKRSSEIHISSKVCSSAERLRDTLAHEICHAACFIINQVNDGHGSIWRNWANLINITYPRIPKITVSHSYFVEKKYIYKCQTCHMQ